VALAVDAWWSARENADRETTILRDLAAEFRANREQLSRDIRDNEGALAATSELLRLGARQLSSMSTDSARKLAERAVTLRTFDPSNAVLRSVLSAGDFDVIRSADLRSAIAAWDDGLIELFALKAEVNNWTNAQILPVLYSGSESNLNIPALLGIVGRFVPHQRHLQSALNESRRHLARADTVLARIERISR
jgi:hypothetical protein